MDKNPSKAEADPVTRPKSVRIEYVKSPLHRSIHAEGAWGGINGRRMVVFSFWNERGSMPSEVVHEVKSEGTLGRVIARSPREPAIVRQFEVEVFMNLDDAKAFRNWLDEKISLLDSPPSSEDESSDAEEANDAIERSRVVE